MYNFIPFIFGTLSNITYHEYNWILKRLRKSVVPPKFVKQKNKSTSRNQHHRLSPYVCSQNHILHGHLFIWACTKPHFYRLSFYTEYPKMMPQAITLIFMCLNFSNFLFDWCTYNNSRSNFLEQDCNKLSLSSRRVCNVCIQIKWK